MYILHTSQIGIQPNSLESIRNHFIFLPMAFFYKKDLQFKFSLIWCSMSRSNFDLRVGWLSHSHGIHMSRSFSLSSIIILTLLAFSCYEIFTESLTRGRKGFLTNLEISIQPTLTRKDNSALKEGLLGVTLLKKSRNVLLEYKAV